MAEFDEKVRSTTEEIERLKKAIEEVKTTIKSYEDMNNFSGGGYEDIINEEIRGLQALNKELDKAKEKLDNLTKVNRGNGHKVKANYENAVLGVEYEKQKNGGVISAEREYEILEKYFKKMSEGTNDSIKTGRRMQEVMDKIDYTSALKRALPSIEKYNALVDEFIQKNGKITDKDRLGIAQDLLSKTNSRSRNYFALNTIASKLQQKIEAEKLSSKPVDTKSSKEEAEKAEQEQTRIAQQQASERVRIAQDEHNKKMQFFDKEYLYKGKIYSTQEKLAYFQDYADKILNSNNFIGMQDEQARQYEQAIDKVRRLSIQLNKELEQQAQQRNPHVMLDNAFKEWENNLKHKELIRGNKLSNEERLNSFKDTFSNYNLRDENGNLIKEYTEISSRIRNKQIELEQEVAKEKQRAEEEQTRIAKQQAEERARVYQEEFDKKMKFFEMEELLYGKKYSTQEKIDWFKGIDTNLRNNQNMMTPEQQAVNTRQLSAVGNQLKQLYATQEQESKQAEQEAKQVVDNIKNKVQEACQFIVSAVSKAIDIVKWSISSIGKVANGIITVFRSIGSIASRIINLLGNFANRIRECTKTTNLLKGSWTELRSAISLISSAMNKLTNNVFIKEGKALLSSIESLNTLIGKDLTQSTIDWANNLERAFGIDASGLVSDMREVAGVLKGLGMSMEDTAIASQNLVSIGQTMSSVIGLDTQTVMNKLYSGMRGMTVAIDDIGLSVRETQMDSFLKKLKAQGGEFANISTSFSQLSEQQRIYVRYAALMDQFMSVYTPEAYAKSLNSITGRLNILSQRLRALKQLIGNFAIQVFNKFVMPLTYAIDIVTAKLKGLFSDILGWMGLNPEDLDLSTGMNHTTVAAEDLADAYDGVADSAENAKKATAGLDDFDHVSTIGSSSSASGADSFDYSSLMNYGDNYATLLEDLAKVQDDYTKKLKESWEELKKEAKDKFNNWYTNLTGRKFDAKFNLVFNKTQIRSIAEHVKNIFKKVFSTGFGLGVMIADDLDIGKIITKALSIIDNITAIIEKAVNKISPYLIRFYEQYMKPYVESFGTFVNEHLNKLMTKVGEWRAFWESGNSDMWLANNADSWFDNISKTINNVINKVKILGVLFGALFTGEVSSDDQILLNESDNAKTLNTVKDIFIDINSVINDIKEVAGELGKDFASWLQNKGLNDIKEVTGKISTFISEHKEDIKNIIEKIAQSKWSILMTLIDKALEICDWLADNSEIVCALIEDISNIIKTIINNIEKIVALGIIAKVTSIIVRINIISKLLGGTGILGTAKSISTTVSGWFTGLSAKIATTAGAIKTQIGGAVSSIGTSISGWFAGASVGGAASAAAVLTLGTLASIRGWKDTMSQAELTKAVDNDKRFNSSDIIDKAAATVKKLREQYKDALDENIYAEAIRTYETYLRNTGEFTEQEIANTINLYAYEIAQYSDAWDSVLSIQGKGWEDWAGAIVDNMYTLEDHTQGLGNVVETETESMYTNFSTIGNGVWTSEQNISSASISIKSALESIKTTFETVKSAFAEQITAKFSAMFNTNTNVNTSNIKWTNGLKTTGLNTFYGHTNGGVPKSGSLFLANENGNSEIVGNFGGYTGVANQNMIIQAMENAVARGMTKAGTNTKSGDTIIKICEGGMFVGDNSTVRKLASMINNANSSSNKTIANSAFSMN